jgi:hypothetical protein
MLSECPIILCIELEPCTGTYSPGLGCFPVGKSFSDLCPKVKFLLFLTLLGIPPFLYLLILPLLMMLNFSARDSKSAYLF